MPKRAWIVLLSGAAIIAISMGARQTFGLFLAPIAGDLSVTREVFGLAIAIQNLMWGVAQPFAGAVADKFGAGRVIVVGGLAYVAGLLLTTVSTDATGLYLSLGVLIGVGLSGTTFAVVLGAVGRVVAEEKRSMALGLTTAGGSLGMFVFVPAGQAVLSSFGWIAALAMLAATAALMPMLAAGVAGRPERRQADQLSGISDPSLGDALVLARQHNGYWLLNAGFLVCGFQLAFIATHLPAFLADQRTSPMTAALALALIGFFNVVGTYLWGVLGGRYRKKYLLSTLYLARSAVITLFLLLPITDFSVLAFGAVIGLLWLGTVPLTSGLVVQIFGPRYLGTLFGVVFLSHQIGSFLGAWLGGYVYDSTGSYDSVWLAGIALGIAAALLHWPIADAPAVRVQPSPLRQPAP
jgi:predicted MFS family arabinose efflux permease